MEVQFVQDWYNYTQKLMKRKSYEIFVYVFTSNHKIYSIIGYYYSINNVVNLHVSMDNIVKVNTHKETFQKLLPNRLSQATTTQCFCFV